MFRNRSEAGRQLAYRLRKFQGQPVVILAIPRGGVPVAYEIAKALERPLEVALVKKLGHPLNKEYAIGAVGLHDIFLIPHEDVTESYITMQTEKVRRRLNEMKQKFMGSRQPEDIRDKTVIVVDDGIATGNTLLATINILKKSLPGKIIVATPVVSRSAAQKLETVVDEIIAIMIPEVFYGVGRFYEDFTQVTDEEVIHYLKDLNEIRKAG